MEDKKTSRHAGPKTLKCDIDGMACISTPTYCRLGAFLPTRCASALHKMPEIVLKNQPAAASSKLKASLQRDMLFRKQSCSRLH